MINKLNLINIIIFLIIIIFLSGFIYCLNYFYTNIFVIEELKSDQMEILEDLEKKYGKKYPLGNDYFRIIHNPSYNTFFEQFIGHNYLVKKNKNQIISTCCFANIYKDIYYICDLKKIGVSKHQTFDFFIYAYLILGIRKMFGIVMEPNYTINHLTSKYGFVKISQLKLYKIKFVVIKKNMHYFNKIFPHFFITPGFKKFILESNNFELKCYHIAQFTDYKITIKPVKSIGLEKINDDDDIMFCINTKSNLNYLLEIENIFPTNLMSIITNKQFSKEEFDFNLIKTYMI